MAKAKPFLPITERRKLSAHFRSGTKTRSLVQLLSSSNKPLSTQQIIKRTGLGNLSDAICKANQRLAMLGYAYRITGTKHFGAQYQWQMKRIEQKRRA